MDGDNAPTPIYPKIQKIPAPAGQPALRNITLKQSLRVPLRPGVRAGGTLKIFPVLFSEKNDTCEKYMIID